MSTKSKLLELLEKQKGSYLSGEALAQQLEVSRTAVWKAIKSLRQEGYQIQAVTNKGYVLCQENDILSAEAVRCFLEKPEVEIQVFQEISSTSQVMKQKALGNRLPQGSFVAADSQMQGRGRKGRSFYSPKGSGLYLSVLLYPERTVWEGLELTAAAAVAVCKAVREASGVSLDIKWVNDLYLQEKKVCGILTEAVTDFETGDIEFAVVGIGLNLYEPEKGFPVELRQKAGAVLQKGQQVDRNRLAACIVNRLLEEVEKKGIPGEYRTWNMVPGRRIKLLSDAQSRVVLAERILEDGRLVIRNEQGQEEILSAADVSLELW